jgi:hypothetical protein
MFRVHVPFSADRWAFCGRYGAISCGPELHGVEIHSSDSVELVHTSTPFQQSPIDCLDLSGTGVVVSSDSDIAVVDLTVGSVSTEYSASACPSIITSLRWNGPSIFVTGSQSGSVQIWDIRQSDKSALIAPAQGVGLPVSLIRFGPSSDSMGLTTVHDNALVLGWDFRSLRMPTTRFLMGSVDEVLEVVYTVDDMIVVSSSGYTPVGGGEPKYSKSGIFSATVLSGSIVAISKDFGEIEIIDVTTGESVVDPVVVPHSSIGLGYLRDSNFLCSFGQEGSILCCPIEGATTPIDPNTSASLAPSPSRRTTILSSTLSSPQMAESPEWRKLSESCAQIIRRVRRIRGVEIAELEEGIIGFELSVSMGSGRCLTGLVQMDSVDIWVTGENEGDDYSEYIRNLKNNFPLDLLDPRSVVDAIRSLVNELVPVESVEHTSPFPNTCGMCWSPRGDLYRFHSLRGLSPWPVCRPKLTMAHFLELPQRSSDSQRDSETQKIFMNDFLPFVENEQLDENTLDREFNRRVTTDTCVQFLPSVVFESTVEDHWFSAIGPVVQLDGSASEIAARLHEFTKQLVRRNPGEVVTYVNGVWSIVAEIFQSLESLDDVNSSGLIPVCLSALEEIISELYAREQTQTVAVLLVIIARARKFYFSEQLDSLLPSLTLVVHDHISLFQRLMCFETARMMEKVAAEDLGTYFPDKKPMLLVDPESMRVGTPVCDCAVCGFAVHGLGQFCSACGHGGHIKHMNEHFSKSQDCLLCECNCEDLIEGTKRVGQTSGTVTSPMAAAGRLFSVE